MKYNEITKNYTHCLYKNDIKRLIVYANDMNLHIYLQSSSGITNENGEAAVASINYEKEFGFYDAQYSLFTDEKSGDTFLHFKSSARSILGCPLILKLYADGFEELGLHFKNCGITIDSDTTDIGNFGLILKNCHDLYYENSNAMPIMVGAIPSKNTCLMSKGTQMLANFELPIKSELLIKYPNKDISVKTKKADVYKSINFSDKTVYIERR